MIDRDLWTEQADFNSMLRVPLSDETATKEFLRDMILNLVSESDELLRTSSWKSHRRQDSRPNREHRLEECIDIFKIWLTIVQGLGFSPSELEEAFWRKSMVVRQRHSEEWVKTLADRPLWVVDIDNVLCDYTTGFCEWLAHRAPLFAPKTREVLARRAWVSRCDDLGMSEAEWQGFKHEFRSNGQKRRLPLMPGAKEFLHRLQGAGYGIVLLTSRPIDRYPNIYGDTLYWLYHNSLPHDWVWWATDKGERVIESGITKQIHGVVDDDPRYVTQFARLGLPVWHLQSTSHPTIPMDMYQSVHAVHSLGDIPVPSLAKE